jgi:hypothetical protein
MVGLVAVHRKFWYGKDAVEEINGYQQAHSYPMIFMRLADWHIRRYEFEAEN